MKRLVLLGVLQFGLSLALFLCFQIPEIYNSTLGRFSENYERVNIDGRSKIVKSSIPFVQINEDSFERWDASIYRCLKEKMYSTEEGCYHNVRGAFFPLFPIVWKMSGLSRIGISIFNYCLFFLSLVLMTWLFQEDSKPDLLRFTVLLTFPSSIIFYLPYTEGCFIATMSIMVAGILRGRYMMYFLGAALLAMVRPATVFVLLALIAVQVVKFLQGRKWVECLFSGIRYTLPFATGYFFSAAIQRYYSGSWTIFFQAQKSWEGGRLTGITRITDWSIEGFGLSAFAIFFICLPATFYLLRYVWKHLQKVNRRPMSATEEIWLVSLFYLAGIFVYIAATSGGNLHSLWRFTLGSPPFFIAAFLACHQLELKKVSPLILYLVISAASLFLFLYFVPYGGKRIDFSFAGMYLAILSWSFVILKRKGTTLPWLLMAIPLILLNVVWNVFLFNAFLSRAWIFT